MATKYPDARPGTYEDGSRYEQFVAQKVKYLFGKTLLFFEGKEAQLQGENAEGLEIKFDGLLKKTGNVYIEVMEKSLASRANYYPSGAFRDDNTKTIWIGDYAEAFLFDKRVLRQAAETGKYEKKQIPTSQGFLLSRDQAEKLCKQHLFFAKQA